MNQQQNDFFEQVSGSPCVNCHASPKRANDLYCSDLCQRDYEGNPVVEEEFVCAHPDCSAPVDNPKYYCSKECWETDPTNTASPNYEVPS